MHAALLTVVSAGLLAGGAESQTTSDDFNRAPGTSMGSAWSEQQGDTRIQNNMGRGNSPFVTGWMYSTTLAGDYASSMQSIDLISSGFGGDSIALMAGLDPGTWDCVYVKLQDNDGDSFFDRVFFYRGVNGGSWGGSSVFYDLLTPTKNATLTLSFANAGDTAVLDVYNATSGIVEQFTGAGLLSMSFGPPSGTNVGIAHFGDAFFDNWSAQIGTLLASASTLSLASGGSIALSMDVGSTEGLLPYVIAGSLSGTSPGSSVLGATIPLNPDLYTILTLQGPGASPLSNHIGTLNAAGQTTAVFTLPALTDPSLAGLTVDHAGVVLDLAPGAWPLARAVTNPASFDLVP